MENRAIHLQAQAHVAVARALRNGALQRKPCEECSDEPAQAHHDSYFPEDFLKVRWLCPKHHKKWHDENEPKWPTIFDYHPSDDPRLFITRRAGRPPKPWYWKTRRVWAVTIRGKRYNLGGDEKEAYAKFLQICEQYGYHECTDRAQNSCECTVNRPKSWDTVHADGARKKP